MIKKALSLFSVLGFTAAAGYFWEKGDAEVAVGIVGILVTIVIAVLQTAGSQEKRRNSRLGTFFRGRDFKKQYYIHLRYQNRDFDIKGLSTQTKYTLELDQVFVELKLQPQAAHKATSDPLQNVPLKYRKDSYPVWRFFTLLSEENAQNPKIVIVGPPGSGKTTLLKHMALLLATTMPRDDESKTKIRKIPVIIFLRDHVNDITNNPAIMLPEVIEANIKKLDLESIPNWFSGRLKKGECLVLLDGLDEVADTMARRKVVDWMEKQIHIYPKNAFIITSRPHGYKENPITGVTVLEVMPFNRSQIDTFVHRWYLANEIKSHTVDDPGVRMTAKSGADDLLRRLERNATLMELAVNPLLLTMIATVHRYRSALPGRRVELYKEICEVFLGKRQESKGISIDMVPSQKQHVLETLAYEMMDGNIREIRKPAALEIIKSPLSMVAPTLDPEVFLKSVEQQTGLVLERELGIYSFAHKTFQEYLASMYILDKNLESELYDRINDDWWHEVIKLYSAQTDATDIIRTCLDQDPPSAVALSLAVQCLEEAQQVKPELRDIAERILLVNAEDPDPEIRKIIAQALLSSRLKHLFALSPSISIDTKLVTNAEYQIFVDDMIWRSVGEYYPVYWSHESFPPGSAHNPVVGLTPDDAMAFCDWLTELHAGSGEWYFRLPLKDEVDPEKYPDASGFWVLKKLGVKGSKKFEAVEMWKNDRFSWPTVPETLIKKAPMEDIKSAISSLRAQDISKRNLGSDSDLYHQLNNVLQNLLKTSSGPDKLLTESANDLYALISSSSFSRPVDYGYGSDDLEAYDQGLSDTIDRIANADFEAGIMLSLKCFSNIVRSNVRTIDRFKPLYLAYAFILLAKWLERNKSMFMKTKMESLQRKVEYLVDHYIDHLVNLGRKHNITQPFEGLLFVKEIKPQA